MTTFRPTTEEEVAGVVRWAASAHEPLAMHGGGSRAGFGHAVSARHTICMTALTGIRAYDPRELVLTAAAGTPRAEIDDALAQHHQYLPFEPPCPRALFGTGTGGTFGGLFVANQSGPRRMQAGAARDFLLGVRAVNGRGEIWKAGGRVIKNVTGYDLARLLAGSWGTLSAVTELTCKVLPAPPSARTVAVPATDTAAAMALFDLIMASRLGPTALAWVPATCEGIADIWRRRVLVRFEASAAGTDERVAALARLVPGAIPVPAADDAAAMWRALRDADPVAAAEVVVKVSAPPARMAGLTRLVAERGVADWYLDCAGAWLWAGAPATPAPELVGALRAALQGDGAVVIQRAPEAVKTAAGVLTPPPAPLAALLRRLRDAFDPLGLFNPGRLYPR